MQKFLSIVLLLLISASSFAQKNNSYRFKVNLNRVNEDKLLVTLNVPKIKKQKTLTYHIPKIVPGTYSISDFGRFVSEFKAYNRRGKELKVKQVDSNTWKIFKARKVAKVTYVVQDSWDTDIDENVIFEPAGTNIELGENFVFNNFGFFGYFKGFDKKEYFVEVDRPEKFYGATSLDRVGGDEDTDIFYAANYFNLADAPIMFCEPDTVMFKVGNTDVLISTYSPNKAVKSKDLTADIKPILEAQRAYLGGTLPVDRYAFLLYLNDDNYKSGSAGALEHSYSSFYCLFEGEPSQIAQTIRDVAAHEFFHIVTPLNIHSEEIQYFDFIEPKMSEHLWMYEGVTEYSAQHVQIKQGLMPIDQFLSAMSGKIRVAERFNRDLPFTDMSRECLDTYKDQYINVYNQGALIGMALDLKLRILSKGDYGIQELMQDLSKEFGPDKPFKDSELFGKITELTYPEIGTFLTDHVSGTKPLPYKDLLGKAGVDYMDKGIEKQLSPLGGAENPGVIGADSKTMKIVIEDESKLDEFGRNVIGLKNGDALLKIDGETLNFQNVNRIVGAYFGNAELGQEHTITVGRGEEEVDLTFKLEEVGVEVTHFMKEIENCSPEQEKIRKAWLGDYIK